MLSRSLKLAFAMAAALAVASVASAAQPAAPSTQPEAAAFAPTSQPDFTGVSKVSFYLTRSLPPNLQRRQLIAMRNLPRNEQLKGIRATIADAKLSVDELVRRKHELDDMPRERQDHYRQWALQLEDIYSRLTPTQLAELRNMTPEKRAKRIRELLAELKAKAIRDGNKQQNTSPPK